MGLFGKKAAAAELCVVFVGKFTSLDPAMEQRLAAIYDLRAQSLVKQCYPGLRALRVWCFNKWIDHAVSPAVLQSLQREGVSASDRGEKKELTQAMGRILTQKYGAAKGDPHPTVILETSGQYAGTFAVLCKVSVSENALLYGGIL